MSLILDALKKLDREKSSRRNGTANIAAEILKPSMSRPGKRILRYFTTISLTAIAAAAITYAAMGGFGLARTILSATGGIGIFRWGALGARHRNRIRTSGGTWRICGRR